MTTWTEATDNSATYTAPSDLGDGYALAGYWINGYVEGSLIWVTVNPASTEWA